jgi:23S rRNA pseudouridine1911/1915/1917 synthase
MKLPAGASDEVKNKLRQFERQALHAKKLTLIHPQTGEEMSWEVDLPEDMQNLLAVLSEQ